MSPHKVTILVAAAGAGKTTRLVDIALENRARRVLLTTYTDSNRDELVNAVIQRVGIVPENIHILPWYTFLLRECIVPYLKKSNFYITKRITGMLFVDGQDSALRVGADGEYSRTPKSWISYYFDNSFRIFSDKVSEFAIKLQNDSYGAAFERIGRIYDLVLIDEFQDIASYDLDIVKLLSENVSSVILAGDPRQVAYVTNKGRQNSHYKRCESLQYFKDNLPQEVLNIDDYSLSVSHRCHKGICDFASLLFPDYKSIISGNGKVSGHDGIFFVRESNLQNYYNSYRPFSLRWDSARSLPDFVTKVANIGVSKGHSYNDILLFPTTSMIDWLRGDNGKLKDQTLCKLYIAVTRARQSAAIVVPNDFVRSSAFRCVPFWPDAYSGSDLLPGLFD